MPSAEKEMNLCQLGLDGVGRMQSARGPRNAAAIRHVCEDRLHLQAELDDESDVIKNTHQSIRRNGIEKAEPVCLKRDERSTDMPHPVACHACLGASHEATESLPTVESRVRSTSPRGCREHVAARTDRHSAGFTFSGSMGYLYVVALCLSCVAHIGANPVSSPKVSSKRDAPAIVPPYVSCGNTKCDLRTHYCDKVINSCARCDDDCHPGRITGNAAAEAECARNCGWYYMFTSTPTTTTTTMARQSPLPAELQSAQGLGASDSMQTIEYLLIAIVIILGFGLSAIAIVLAVRNPRCVQCQCNKGKDVAREKQFVQDPNAHCRPNDSSEKVETSLTDSPSVSFTQSEHTTRKVLDHSSGRSTLQSGVPSSNYPDLQVDYSIAQPGGVNIGSLVRQEAGAGRPSEAVYHGDGSIAGLRSDVHQSDVPLLAERT